MRMPSRTRARWARNIALTLWAPARVDEVAAQAAQARERALLVGAGEAAAAADVGDQDRRALSGLAHCSGTPALRMPSMLRSNCVSVAGSSFIAV